MVVGPIEDSTEEEIERALKEMNKKVLEPSGVSSDMLNRAGRTGARELTNVYQKVLKRE